MLQNIRVIPGEKQHFSDPSLSNDSSQYGVYAYYLAQIISCCQQVYGTHDNIESQLASSIASMTGEQMSLHLHRQSISSTIMMPLMPGHRGFLVYWGEVVYGSLQVNWPERSHEQPVLSAALCERLAYDCGWCLHVLDTESLRQRQIQQTNKDAQQKVQDLSASEYEVLKLMVKGFSTRTIADTLHVSKRTIETHQRHIYQILDVHSQREAILIGLAAGLTTS
ncbi:MAG TPA: LuxR C-terminal-related transcriptional regulator [Ktedonobacteraceae bacterium]|nr:LuxR C-terminal-related transcriptional regulator [Ktedonobacteraceae bacterium]